MLVWDEQQPAQKTAYGKKFLGETITAQHVQEGRLGLVAQIPAAERTTEDSRLSRCQKWRADVGLTPKTI